MADRKDRRRKERALRNHPQVERDDRRRTAKRRTVRHRRRARCSSSPDLGRAASATSATSMRVPILTPTRSPAGSPTSTRVRFHAKRTSRSCRERSARHRHARRPVGPAAHVSSGTAASHSCSAERPGPRQSSPRDGQWGLSPTLCMPSSSMPRIANSGGVRPSEPDFVAIFAAEGPQRADEAVGPFDEPIQAGAGRVEPGDRVRKCGDRGVEALQLVLRRIGLFGSARPAARASERTRSRCQAGLFPSRASISASSR